MTDKEAKEWAANYAAMNPEVAAVLRMGLDALVRSLDHTVTKNDNGTYSHTFRPKTDKVK